jgi:hypothetical protein
MQSIRVKELMVPLTDYPTVQESGTLYDAVLALQESQGRFDPSRAKHRAVLILDRDGHVVGKIGFLDLLQGLEPGYGEVDALRHAASGFTPEFIKSLLEKHRLWQEPLGAICAKATRIKVKDTMYKPGPSELIPEEATLDEAVHHLVVDRRQSLLVTRGQAVVGVLRLSDVVEKVCSMIQACTYPSGD